MYKQCLSQNEEANINNSSIINIKQVPHHYIVWTRYLKTTYRERVLSLYTHVDIK